MNKIIDLSNPKESKQFFKPMLKAYKQLIKLAKANGYKGIELTKNGWRLYR